MRIAFHAPLKPPDHPVASGDRRMARALLDLLRRQGHAVVTPSRLRTYDRVGDPWRQLRLRTLGTRLADRLWRRLQHERSLDLWLTYHCYHKAPDWLGPPICRALDLPYVIAEPSHAAKQARGPWAIGHAGAADAIRAADLLLAMTTDDAEGLAHLVRAPSELRRFPPFLDAAPLRAAAAARPRRRALLAATHGLDPARPWLLTVAMMRADVKRQSYAALADALGRLRDLPWQLVVAGDGEARAAVAADLRGLGADRALLVGALAEEPLRSWYAAADLFVWPAWREAYGLAMLEAQAAGLPVVAGREGGVAEVVHDGESGILVPGRDAEAFAAAVRALLADPVRRQAMGAAATARVAVHHDLGPASARLVEALEAARRIHALRRRRAA